MKNKDISNLVQTGLLGISANDLDTANAYKVMKFKRSVKKAFESLAEAEKDLLKEAGIEDGAAFDKELARLRKDNSEPERLAEMEQELSRYLSLREALYDEEVTLDCKTIPFEQFHILQKENKGINGKPLNIFDDILEGVLWAEPESE